ncbi:hypothetical protein DTL42_22760 [Bremerella cremea]|uniref:Uncharacterized protein n=2 Tax=Bremerella cremea TaxID=1031537 RepID=A0A368KL08_9BACT|nr:hypothetical protein DTL42_22760 [Bremerella cremea]
MFKGLKCMNCYRQNLPETKRQKLPVAQGARQAVLGGFPQEMPLSARFAERIVRLDMQALNTAQVLRLAIRFV